MDLTTLMLLGSPVLFPGAWLILLDLSSRLTNGEDAGTIDYEILTRLGSGSATLFEGRQHEIPSTNWRLNLRLSCHCRRIYALPQPRSPMLSVLHSTRGLLAQMIEIGFFTSVVGLTAVFAGMVYAPELHGISSMLKARSQHCSDFHYPGTLGRYSGIDGLGPNRRIHRAGNRAMRVTEQVDALTTLSLIPSNIWWYRLIAGLAMLPLLVFVADIIGVLGGYLVGRSLGFVPRITSIDL